MKLKNTYKLSDIFNINWKANINWDTLRSFFRKETLFLILIAAAIFFSPTFTLGVIPGGRKLDIRIEDILLVIFGIRWLLGFSTIRKQRKPPLFWPILALLGFIIFTSLINLFLKNVNIVRVFFFTLKEIEFFFLYFFVFYNIKNISSIFKVINAWFFFGIINLGWLLFQIITKNPLGEIRRGVHYLNAIGESGIFPVAGFFLLLFINLFAFFIFCYPLFQKKQKIFYSIVISGFILGVVGMMRRGSLIAFVFSFILLLFLYFWKTKKIKPFSIKLFYLIIPIVIIAAIFITILFVQNVSVRAEFISKEVIMLGINARLYLWEIGLHEIISKNPFYVFFGFGKSFPGEPHNQYVKNLIETGLIGSLIFIILIFYIFKKTIKNFLYQKNPLKIALSAGILVSTIAMLIISLPADAFMVVKISEVYWFFMGMAMAALTFNKEEKLINEPKDI